jgi:hypothetical protein
MSSKFVIHAGAALLLASTAVAEGACDAAAMQQYHDCVQIVSWLRPDKAGQQRVFARDGSEFTAGQAIWMRQQLRKVERLCAHSTAADQAQAAKILTQVQQLLKSHQRSS